MSAYSKTKRPSQHLHDLLSGKVEPKDTPAPVLSWARLEIFNAAKAVISAPDKQKRRAMLDKIPPSIRPFVEREAMKMWRDRDDTKTIPTGRP